MIKMKSNNLQYAFYAEYYQDYPNLLKEKEEFEEAKKIGHDENMEEPDIRYYKQRNMRIMKIASQIDIKMERISKYNQELDILEFKTSYPGVLIGSGYTHAVKGKGEIGMGFTFDYVTGLPYLPGSSLKGLLRFGFSQMEYITELIKSVSDMELSEEEIKELSERIFDGNKMKKKFIFFDGIISNHKQGMPLLALDTITPHSKNGLGEPNPITFLRICPETKFHFEFQLQEIILSEEKKMTKDKIRDIFKNIIEDLGIGAKTNVGYGMLKNNLK